MGGALKTFGEKVILEENPGKIVRKAFVTVWQQTFRVGVISMSAIESTATTVRL